MEFARFPHACVASLSGYWCFITDMINLRWIISVNSSLCCLTSWVCVLPPKGSWNRLWIFKQNINYVFILRQIHSLHISFFLPQSQRAVHFSATWCPKRAASLPRDINIHVSGSCFSIEGKMAAVGQLSRVLLRSALTQSRRQFSAAAAEHGEHSGTCVVLTRYSFLVRFIQSNKPWLVPTVTLLRCL